MTETRTIQVTRGQFAGKQVTIKPSSPENIKKEREAREKYLKEQLGKAEFQGRIKRRYYNKETGELISESEAEKLGKEKALEVVETTSKASQRDVDTLQQAELLAQEKAKEREEFQARKQAWIDQYGQQMYNQLRTEQEIQKQTRITPSEVAPSSSSSEGASYYIPRTSVKTQETEPRPYQAKSSELPVLEKEKPKNSFYTWNLKSNTWSADNRSYKSEGFNLLSPVYYLVGEPDSKKLDQKIQKQKEGTLGAVFLPIAYEGASAVKTFSQGAEELVRKPWTLITTPFEMISNPVETAQDVKTLIRQAPTEPGAFIGNVGFIVATGEIYPVAFKGGKKIKASVEEYNFNKRINKLDQAQKDAGYNFFRENDMRFKATDEGARLSKSQGGAQSQIYWKNLDNHEVVAFEIGERIRQERAFLDWRNADLSDEARAFINKKEGQVKLTSGKYGDLENPFKVEYIEGDISVYDSVMIENGMLLEGNKPGKIDPSKPFEIKSDEFGSSYLSQPKENIQYWKSQSEVFYIGKDVKVTDTSSPAYQKALLNRKIRLELQKRGSFLRRQGEVQKTIGGAEFKPEENLKYAFDEWINKADDLEELGIIEEKPGFFSMGKRGSSQIGVSETIIEGSQKGARLFREYFSESPEIIKPFGESAIEPKAELTFPPVFVYRGITGGKEFYKERELVFPGEEEKSEGKERSALYLNLRNEYEEREKLLTLPGQETIYKADLRFRDKVKLDEDQAQDIIIEQRQEEEAERRFYPIFRKPRSPRVETPKEPRKTLFSLNAKNKTQSFNGGGFNVLAKSRGSFVLINPEPLSRSDAIKFGASRIGSSAMASFKIIETSSPATGEYSGSDFDLSDFYEKNGLFIEKRSRRIKSPGEKAEITYQGIQARRRKL